MRAWGVILVAALAAASLAATAHASRYMRVGIYDEAQTLYGPVDTTFATFKPGHRLRVAIGTGDAPHTVPGTSRLVDSVGAVFMISRSPAFASYLTLPVVRI